MFKKYLALFNPRLILHLFLLLTIDWLFYLGMWFTLCMHQFGALKILLIAVNYAAASIIGMLFIILPSGLVIRESSFIMIGQYLGGDLSLLLVLSIIVRFLYLLGDIILYGTVTIYNQIKND